MTPILRTDLRRGLYSYFFFRLAGFRFLATGFRFATLRLAGFRFATFFLATGFRFATLRLAGFLFLTAIVRTPFLFFLSV